MRNHQVLLVVLVVGTFGCASRHDEARVHQECGLDSDWALIATPSDALGLMKLAEWEATPRGSHDHWLRSTSGNVRLCRVLRFGFVGSPPKACGIYDTVEFASNQASTSVVDNEEIVCLP